MTLHPAVAPVIEAVNALADYRPTSATDLADVLKSVHEMGRDNLIKALASALYRFGMGATANEVTAYLNDAAEHLSALGCDDIDRAREATGHWYGSAGTDSYL
jgi:hypothetical protein